MKLYKLSLLLCLSILFVACSKDPEAPKASMDVWEEEPAFTIEDGKVSVCFSGNVEYKGKIKRVTLKLDATSYPVQLDGATFSVCVPDLNPDAEYHYRYCIDYGVSPEYVVEKNLTTPALPEPVVTKPTVVTEDVTLLGVRGNVTDNGGAPIIERGICWGTEPNPDISGMHIQAPIPDGYDGMGAFLLLLNLDPGVYYVCAYAINSSGLPPGYGEDLILVAK